MKFNKEAIINYLPHRDPFLFLDSVQVDYIASKENIVGTKVSGSLFLNPELELFKGHFPSFPVFPGVLQIEALSQLSCFTLAPYKGSEKLLFFLLQTNNFKFKKMCRPNDTLILKSEIINKKAEMLIFKVSAFINDQEVCSGEIWGTAQKNEK